MTVAELIAELSRMDPDRVVICQKDSEGNGYSPLAGVDDNAAYSADSTWSGDVDVQTLSAADIAHGYGPEDVAPSTAVPCVVLFPVN